MQLNASTQRATNGSANLFSRPPLPAQNYTVTLGEIVLEILAEGKNVNRQTLCSKLLQRVDLVLNPEDKQHYFSLIAMML